ncbi:hypothetical protein CASFOL_027719 [Castilleja foliolosa]|uniref:Replication factor A C-terminal domain-containing protein n=1 Tax=Castilleja foliolosa TaxID=1961234 RepID=A0ABD3CFL7_9LAMI
MAYSSATLFSGLSDVHSGSTAWCIKARLIRLYKQPAYLNRNEVGSMELVIHDKEGVRIHATMKPNIYEKLTEKMEKEMQEGSVYIIKNFLVIDNTTSFRTTHHNHKLKFFRNTTMSLTDEEFPSHMYNFTPLDQLQVDNLIDEVHLADVIGRVISYQKPFDGLKAKRMDFRIQDTNNNQLSCTLWEDYIDDLLPTLETNEDNKPVIVAIQFGRLLKMTDQVKMSNSFHVTKVTVNADSDVFAEFMARLELNNDVARRMLSNTDYNIYEGFTRGNARVRTLAYLNDFKGDGLFWIDVTIVDIQTTGDFWYSACKKCAKKLVVHPGTKVCTSCAEDNPIETIRFKIEIVVVDQTGSATLLLWNKASELLIGKSAKEMKDKHVDSTDPIPHGIEDALIDRRALFEVRLDSYKMMKSAAYYTVTRCAFDDEIMAIYKQLFGGTQESTSDDHGHLAGRSSEENVECNNKKVDKGKRKLFTELDAEAINDEDAEDDAIANEMQSENVAEKATSGSTDEVQTYKKRQPVIKKEK